MAQQERLFNFKGTAKNENFVLESYFVKWAQQIKQLFLFILDFIT